MGLFIEKEICNDSRFIVTLKCEEGIFKHIHNKLTNGDYVIVEHRPHPKCSPSVYVQKAHIADSYNRCIPVNIQPIKWCKQPIALLLHLRLIFQVGTFRDICPGKGPS